MCVGGSSCVCGGGVARVCLTLPTHTLTWAATSCLGPSSNNLRAKEAAVLKFLSCVYKINACSIQYITTTIATHAVYSTIAMY